MRRRDAASAIGASDNGMAMVTIVVDDLDTETDGESVVERHVTFSERLDGAHDFLSRI